ncbi:MAG: hypothetical protein ABEJ99_04060 [Candidatus Nanohaloarchaea archaeon]
MSEVLYEFKEGPYDVLDYKITRKDDRIIISINDGDLGRLPIEDIDAVDHLREALDKIEQDFKEAQRRKEEL